MTVHHVPADTGERIDNGPMSMRILEDGGNTGHRLGVAEVRLAAGAQGPPQHIHREHEETFYVVSGVVVFTSGADTLLVRPGGLVTAPIGTPHTFANGDSDEDALIVCTVTPDQYIGYFRELRELANGPDGIDRRAQLELMKRYATDPYRPAESS
jgi:quercetin dioxygenase-like cupin family protein